MTMLSNELEDRMFWRIWTNTFLLWLAMILYFLSCLAWLANVTLTSTLLEVTSSIVMLTGLSLKPGKLRRYLTWGGFVSSLLPFALASNYEIYEVSDYVTFSLHIASMLCFAILSETRMALSRMFDFKESIFRNRIHEQRFVRSVD